MNIYDIAKEAGVSIATVSRVINNKGAVSDKTRTKIEAIMAKSEYQPSAIARGLASGSTKIIAIFAVDVRVPHYAKTSFIMERLLSDQGYMVFICNTGEEISDWRRYLSLMRERNIDGIILTGSIYNRLEKDDILNGFSDIPIVMANGRIKLPNVKSVFVDEGRGIELATEHMFPAAIKSLRMWWTRTRNPQSARKTVLFARWPCSARRMLFSTSIQRIMGWTVVRRLL